MNAEQIAKLRGKYITPAPAGWHEILDENERLRAIADKLPQTADGVSVVPGLDTVWITWSEEAKQTPCTWRLMHLRGHRCYSTREAAEAAGGE